VQALATVTLVTYYALLTLLSFFGLRRLYILIQYYRLRAALPPASAGRGSGAPDPDLPVVTVQLPIFNEVHVVERLLRSMTRLDWPRDRLEIQVLDDSTDETTPLVARLVGEYRSQGIDIHHIHRDSRAGYKAGALANGLTAARGELVAIFDADFVPPPDFLRRTTPFFADPKLAFVQGGWEHMNREHSLLTRVQAILLDAHFRFEHTVRSLSGYFVNFTGTGGVWRARAIADAGGWQHDTLIEDADLAYRAHLRGWRGLHLPDLLCPSELPEDPSAWRSQQQRWAKGNAQVLRKLMPAIARSSASLGAKVECFLHLTSNCIHPVNLALAILLVPSMWVRRGSVTLLALDAALFTLNFVWVAAYFALSQRERPGMTTATRRWLRELRVLPSLMAIGIGSSLSQSRAVVGGLFGRDLVFHRTPKAGRMRRPTGSYRAPMSRLVLVEAALAMGYATAIVVAVARGHLASLPFLVLFFHGFLHVAGISAWESIRLRLGAGAEREGLGAS
jgi:cellulose synthase/poly-beta-1,6-N-acetylglucosamine synthase-like glycosyltransferase